MSHAALLTFRRLGGQENPGSICAADDGGLKNLRFRQPRKKLKAVLQTMHKMKKKGGALSGIPALMEL